MGNKKHIVAILAVSSAALRICGMNNANPQKNSSFKSARYQLINFISKKNVNEFARKNDLAIDIVIVAFIISFSISLYKLIMLVTNNIKRINILFSSFNFRVVRSNYQDKTKSNVLNWVSFLLIFIKSYAIKFPKISGYFVGLFIRSCITKATETTVLLAKFIVYNINRITKKLEKLLATSIFINYSLYTFIIPKKVAIELLHFLFNINFHLVTVNLNNSKNIANNKC